MTSVFQSKIGLSFYKTQIGEALNICEAGYEECSASKPCEFIPIDYSALHYCIKGEGILQIRDQIYHIYPGDLFRIPPHTGNRYFPVPENPWCYRWVGICGSSSEALLSECGLPPDGPPVRYPVDSELESYFEKIYDACQKKEEIAALAGLYQLLAHIKKRHCEHASREPSCRESLFKELLRYIHLHYCQKISVASMAAESSIDRTYIFKLFKEYAHVSPSEYLLEYRLEKACMLLRKTMMSITEISFATGFQSAPYFSRIFTRRKGQTPSSYRKQFVLPVTESPKPPSRPEKASSIDELCALQ